MKKQTYIKCPRCELNYILKKDKCCDVCKLEMKPGAFEELDFEDFEEGLELCPSCRANYLLEGETICTTCFEENAAFEKEEEADWRVFVEKADVDTEDLDLLPVEENDEIDQELGSAFAKDLDEDFDDEDEEDLLLDEELDNLDDLDLDLDLDDEDFDDEDEDEADDEDFDDEDF